jgi:hypothetical protein
MALKRLTLTPGINKDATPTAGMGGWYDANLVRFRNGLPEKIGGWVPVTQFKVLGVPRALIGWVALDGTNLLGVGTNLKYYTEVGGTLTDITPVRKTAENMADPFAVTTSSNVVTVTAASHGATDGDYVTISGSEDVGGVPADQINTEHKITVVDGNTFTFTVTTAATSDVSAGGGSAVDIEYQTNIGLATYVVGVGWGAGPWGAGGWGSPKDIGIGQQLVIWNAGTFGQTLLYGQRGAAIYKWDPTDDRGSRGSAVTGSDIPTLQDVMLVTDQRFVMVGGTDNIGGGDYDPLLVRWSDQEDYTEWSPSITNQAGDYRLSEGSYIVTALQTKQEVLIWTDSALYSAQYVGTPWVWSFALVLSNLSIISPNAVATVSGLVFWMGRGKFYVYSGQVNPLPCTITNYIFSDINISQAWQIFCGTNEAFNEVWWFYCSADSLTVDRYVVFNYAENTWSCGKLSRTAWIEAAGRPNPIATTQDGQLIYHESGTDDVLVGSSKGMNAYILSSDIDLQDGEVYGFAWRMIPDISFAGSTIANPKVTFGVQGRRNPGAAADQNPSGPVQRMVTTPVETFTEYVYTRVRGRQMAIKVSSTDKGVQWRLGTPRIDIQADGGKI